MTRKKTRLRVRSTGTQVHWYSVPYQLIGGYTLLGDKSHETVSSKHRLSRETVSLTVKLEAVPIKVKASSNRMIQSL